MSILQIMGYVIGIAMIILAIVAIESRKIINSVILLSVLSIFVVISYVIMQALDVAITEAVIGSGIGTALFLFTMNGINKIKDRDGVDS